MWLLFHVILVVGVIAVVVEAVPQGGRGRVDWTVLVVVGYRVLE